MKGNLLRTIGSPSMERLGAAPNSEEMRGMSEDRTTPHEIGRVRVSLWQCACLRWGRASETECDRCGLARPGAG